MRYDRGRRARTAAPILIATALLFAACAPEPGPGQPTTPAPSDEPRVTPSPSGTPTPTVTPGAAAAPSPSAGAAEVTIITADLAADGLEVTGIVTGQTEAEAVCTLTARRGGEVVSAEVAVNPSGGNSYCPLLLIPRERLSRGTWELVLDYSSAAGVTGRSAPLEVEVP